AFYPRMKAGFRAGIYADSTPPKFDLRDVELKDVDVTLQFAPYAVNAGTIGYGLAARVEDVSIALGTKDTPTTYLHMNAVDPLVPKFYVRLALKGKHSWIRILDEGKR